MINFLDYMFVLCTSCTNKDNNNNNNNNNNIALHLLVLERDVTME